MDRRRSGWQKPWATRMDWWRRMAALACSTCVRVNLTRPYRNSNAAWPCVAVLTFASCYPPWRLVWGWLCPGRRPAAALPLLEQAVAQATAMHLMLYYALAVASLSEAYLLADNVEQAHEHAVRALALCQAHKEEGHHAWVLRLLGDIAVRREPPDAEEAAACHQAAQTRARALGMRPSSPIAIWAWAVSTANRVRARWLATNWSPLLSCIAPWTWGSGSSRRQ